tara:strand:+ start:6252 stop:6536 length:285 start_codon:yes stop_codon:yes gene_type:complete
MFIDGISGMTLSNNVLRIQVARIDAKGETSTEDIFLPASNINNFVNALVEGVKGLNEQLESENKDDTAKDNGDKKNSKDKKEKASLTDLDDKSK